MSILALVFGLVGGVFALLGIFTGLGALPGFIEAEEGIGTVAATTGFLWGLALLFLVGSIAINIGRNGMGGSPFD
jgi:hypothetical protein